MKRWISCGVVLGLLGTAAVGCGDAEKVDTTPTGDERELGLMAFWYRAGDAAALAAFLALHEERYPDVRITDMGPDGGGTDDYFQAVRDGSAPDLVQLDTFELGRSWPKEGIRSLASFYEARDLNSKVIPSVRDTVLGDGYLDNSPTVPLILPVGVHRENTLVYNKQIFSAISVPPPHDIARI